MDLYQISEQDVRSIVENEKREFTPGEKFIIVSDSLTKYKYPIKIAAKHSEDSIIIVTAYPLKKRREK